MAIVCVIETERTKRITKQQKNERNDERARERTREENERNNEIKKERNNEITNGRYHGAKEITKCHNLQIIASPVTTQPN